MNPDQTAHNQSDLGPYCLRNCNIGHQGNLAHEIVKLLNLSVVCLFHPIALSQQQVSLKILISGIFLKNLPHFLTLKAPIMTAADD